MLAKDFQSILCREHRDFYKINFVFDFPGLLIFGDERLTSPLKFELLNFVNA